MKITSEHFGKKLRRQDWSKDGFFIPLGFSQNNEYVIGEHTSGVSEHLASFINDWELYEETKKKVIKRLAPALCCYNRKFYISDYIFSSEEEAKQCYNSVLYRWPASENMFVQVEVEE